MGEKQLIYNMKYDIVSLKRPVYVICRRMRPVL